MCTITITTLAAIAAWNLESVREGIGALAGSIARAFTGIVAVEIVGNEPGAEDELDQIDLVSISPEVLTRWSVEIIATLRSLEPGTMIAQGYSQSPGGAVLIIEDPTRVSGREVLYLCGNTVEDPGSLHKIFVGRPLDG